MKKTLIIALCTVLLILCLPAVKASCSETSALTHDGSTEVRAVILPESSDEDSAASSSSSTPHSPKTGESPKEIPVLCFSALCAGLFMAGVFLKKKEHSSEN